MPNPHDPSANEGTTRLSTPTATPTSTNPEDELPRPLHKTQQYAKRTTCEHHTDAVDCHAEPDLLEASRMIAEQHEDRWTTFVSSWNSAIWTKQKGYSKQGRPAKRWEDDLNTYWPPEKTNRANNDLTRDMTWLTTTKDNSKCDDVESDFTNNRSKQPGWPTATSGTTATTQPNQQHTSKPRTRLTPTTKTNTTPKTTTIRFSSSLKYLKVELLQNQGNCKKDTRAKSSNQDFSPDAHLEWNACPSQHRYKATFLQATRNPSGTHCLICLERVSSLFANASLQWVDCMSDHGRCLSRWPLHAMSGMIPWRSTQAWTFLFGR